MIRRDFLALMGISVVAASLPASLAVRRPMMTFAVPRFVTPPEGAAWMMNELRVPVLAPFEVDEFEIPVDFTPAELHAAIDSVRGGGA